MESEAREPKTLKIQRNSQFDSCFLLSIDQGTLLMAEDPNIGKEHVNYLDRFFSEEEEEGVGYQYYPNSLIASRKFIIKRSSSIHQATDHEKLRNSLAYCATSSDLQYDIRLSKNGFPIGLILGDTIEGTNFLLLKLLTADSIGWICFSAHDPTKMELQ